jgi:ATP-dependent Lon protease
MSQNQQSLPLLALTSGVVLPGMGFTMALETEQARAAAEAAGSVGGRLVLVPHIDGRYSSTGVIAEILESGRLPGGQEAIVVRGLERASIGTGVPGTGRALWVQVESVDEGEVTAGVTELAREYRAVLENILLSRGARAVVERLREVTEPSQIADLAGYSPDLSLAKKVQVLETVNVQQRLRLVLAWARETLADLALRQQIKTSVEEGMEKTQREFLLRRQLEAIRKELGELEGTAESGTPEQYRNAVAGRELPDGARAALEREIAKLERTSEQSPEQGWIRAWLDTVLEIPWGVTSEDRLDIEEAARVLDADHDGLEDVKERVLEHLAVRSLRAAWPGPCAKQGP